MITIYREFQPTVRNKGMKLRPIAYGYCNLGRCELFAREEKMTNGDTATSYVIGKGVHRLSGEVSWDWGEYFNTDQTHEDAISSLQKLCSQGL